MTIEASDFDHDGDDEIDVIVKSYPFLANNDEVKVEGNGTNDIGWFNFSYYVQNSDSKNIYECSIDSVTTTVMDPFPTSCTYNVSFPVDKSIDQPLVESSIRTTIANPVPASSTASVPLGNGTDQPLAVSSSSLWALIAVAIMLLITLFVTIIIATCIVRNLSMKLKEPKERNACDCDGEHTFPL